MLNLFVYKLTLLQEIVYAHKKAHPPLELIHIRENNPMVEVKFPKSPRRMDIPYEFMHTRTLVHMSTIQWQQERSAY